MVAIINYLMLWFEPEPTEQEYQMLAFLFLSVIFEFYCTCVYHCSMHGISVLLFLYKNMYTIAKPIDFRRCLYEDPIIQVCFTSMVLVARFM